MSEMVERVAQAIVHKTQDDIGDARIAARLAIEAMREPTEDMHIQCGLLGPITIREQWIFMIDEALK